MSANPRGTARNALRAHLAAFGYLLAIADFETAPLTGDGLAAAGRAARTALDCEPALPSTAARAMRGNPTSWMRKPGQRPMRGRHARH